MFDSSAPKRPDNANNSTADPCTTLEKLRPKNARLILPPSVLPIGSKLNAFVRSPQNPVIAKGCSLITDAAGSGVFKIPSPNKYSIIPAPRVDERKKIAGTEGSCCRETISIKAVISNPRYSIPSEVIRPNRGPAIEKSNNDLKFFGGDVIGVMAPVKPN